ncbi:MAG: hypothetical protein AAFR17_17620, partial [Pseudomonadota bacterium]
MYRPSIPVPIGFCLADPEGGFAFQPPRPVFSSREKPLGARAIQNCPAVNGLERRLIEIPSPIGIRLGLEEGDEGPELIVDPVGTFAQPDKIAALLSMEPPARWRHPKRPVIQLRLPFFFVTDAAAMMNIVPPFLGTGLRRWPGMMVATRIPVTIWPQDIVWAFEWDKPGEELVLRQGEPLAYAMFEFDDPNKRPELVEAALTPTLDEWRRGMDGIDHLTLEIEETWEQAKHRRPARLMVPL